MKPQLVLSLLIGKLIFYLTRWLNIGGGSAAPGHYALKIYPQLVVELGNKIPKTVVITGTNGKTTTARMLAHFAKASGLRVIRNHTGSNLERGIASTLIQSVGVKLFHLEGGLRWHLLFDLGIWELDEFAFNDMALKLNPDMVVFLNVFRDQLDRYGEVDTVVKRWCQTLEKLPRTTLVLINGDDKNLLQLKNCFLGKVQSFGVEDYKIEGERVIHSHLPKHQKFTLMAQDIKPKGLEGTFFKLQFNRGVYLGINLPLPGIYHIYDFMAAFMCGLYLNLNPTKMTGALKTFSPAFGRVEKLAFPQGKWEGKQGYIFLIKNPAGATQVFQTINKELKEDDRLLLALNDNLADGTDVSWIWDANFEELQNLSLREPRTARVKLRDLKIYVSGTRAQDLAVRLKYAGFDPKSFYVDSNLKKALEEAKGGLKGRLFILPTYTALLELQKNLAESGVKSHYWKES